MQTVYSNLRDQCRAIPFPIEMGPRIGFAVGGNVAMADHARGRDGRKTLDKGSSDLNQGVVLSGGKGFVIAAFQLDADGEIIAVVAAIKSGSSGVPGALEERYKLHHLAVTPDQQVRGDAQRGNDGKVGVRRGVQVIEKKGLDPGAAVLSRRQADVVNDQEVDRHARWSFTLIGRFHSADIQPTVRSNCPGCHAFAARPEPGGDRVARIGLLGNPGLDGIFLAQIVLPAQGDLVALGASLKSE
ncbi:hypothetical protein CCP4SC76_4750017 [Gammaproteobacteria bacterium]